jgi:hypothetical protein
MFKSTSSKVLLLLIILVVLLALIFRPAKKAQPTEESMSEPAVPQQPAPAVTTSAGPPPTPVTTKPVEDKNDYWLNCPPADRKEAILSQQKEPRPDEDGVKVDFSPVAAFGDLVTVKQTVTSLTMTGTNGSVAEFVTCDTKENRRLMVKDLVSPTSLSKTAEAFGPEASQAAESMANMDNFAVIGIDRDKSLLYLLLGDSGPHGELDARYLDVKLDGDEVAALSDRMQSPRPKAQPFEASTQNLFDMPNEDDGDSNNQQ